MTLSLRRAAPQAAVPADIRRRHRFGSLVQRHVGLVDEVHLLPIEMGAPEIEVASATLGEITMALPSVSGGTGQGGAGTGVEPESAWIRAVVEAAERYATIVHAEQDFVVATARELGSEALALEDIPRCSSSELADARCPLGLPRDDMPIRWLRGYSLISRRERLVPAVMTHLYMPFWKSERFWLQISTGVAAHTSVQAALVGAITEAIERDAIALTWLGRLPLAPIAHSDRLSDAAAEVFDRTQASSIRFDDFDATTDLQIPTVFSVQRAAGHPSCSLTVSCATHHRPEEALAKARQRGLCRAARHEQGFRHPVRGDRLRRLDSWGPVLRSRWARSGLRIFFWTATASPQQLRTCGNGRSSTRKGRIRRGSRSSSIGCARSDMDAIAVDLSTDELRDVGLWVVRVIIPQLMPMTFIQRARYLGTGRLYDYVRASDRSRIPRGAHQPRPPAIRLSTRWRCCCLLRAVLARQSRRACPRPYLRCVYSRLCNPQSRSTRISGAPGSLASRSGVDIHRWPIASTKRAPGRPSRGLG